MMKNKIKELCAVLLSVLVVAIIVLMVLVGIEFRSDEGKAEYRHLYQEWIREKAECYARESLEGSGFTYKSMVVEKIPDTGDYRADVVFSIPNSVDATLVLGITEQPTGGYIFDWFCNEEYVRISITKFVKERLKKYYSITFKRIVEVKKVSSSRYDYLMYIEVDTPGISNRDGVILTFEVEVLESGYFVYGWSDRSLKVLEGLW